MRASAKRAAVGGSLATAPSVQYSAEPARKGLHIAAFSNAAPHRKALVRVDCDSGLEGPAYFRQTLDIGALLAFCAVVAPPAGHKRLLFVVSTQAVTDITSANDEFGKFSCSTS